MKPRKALRSRSRASGSSQAAPARAKARTPVASSPDARTRPARAPERAAAPLPDPDSAQDPGQDPDQDLAQDDGRRQRGARTRGLVLDALFALLAEGNYAPSIQQVSERAGVSRRLVFHHFTDTESMQAAFFAKQTAALSALVAPIPDSLPLPTRLLLLVEQRARIYEKIAPTRRAGLTREYVSPTIASGLAAFRGIKRAQVEAVFAPEIASCHDSVRGEIAAALGCAASFSSWESLRRHQQLGVDAAQRVLTHLLSGVLRLTPAGANLIVLHGAGVAAREAAALK